MKITRRWCRAWRRSKPAFMLTISASARKGAVGKKQRTAEKKTNIIRKAMHSAAVAAGVTLAIMAGSPSAQAMPAGGQVSAGQGSIAQNGSAMTITQNSDKLALNWQSFNIAQGEKVWFNQPNANSVVLNRVLGNDSTRIFGQLGANGKVFLTNQNGILFGTTAQVDVGGLTASSLHINDSDFMAGRYIFTKNGGSGSILNQGRINAAEGGYVALLGEKIVNEGVIVANKGTVVLGSGEQATLDMTGDGLINLAVGQAAINAQVENKNLIQADGGLVVMTANAANNLAGAVVNNSGTIRAQSLTERNGKIVLDGGAGAVNLSGTLDASGNASGQTGGTVKVLGSVIQADNTLINADGDKGGGTVLLGGNRQGQGPEQNAANTTIGQNVMIKANALTNGNGGNVVVWADNTTAFSGHISAQGGISGDGGQAEVSGKEKLIYNGFADLRAANGTIGTLLLDPKDFTIAASGGDMTGAALSSQLNSASVTLYSSSGKTDGSGDINVNDQISWNNYNSTLTLSAANNVNVNQSITSTSAGYYNGIVLSAGNDVNINNAVSTKGRLNVTTSSGDINVNGAIQNGGTSNDISLSAYRNININNTITSTGGKSVILRADNSGRNTGTVTFSGPNKMNLSGSGSNQVNLYYNPATDYTVPTNYTSFVSAGNLTAYMLVNDVEHLQKINTNLSGTYALGRYIYANSTSSWNNGAGFNPIGDSSHPFTGILDGYGGINTYGISSLTINRPNDDNIGLFGVTSGAALRGLNLNNFIITGQNDTGTLAGTMLNATKLSRSYASGSVHGQNNTGGLAGRSDSSEISESYNSVSVTGGNSSTGGLAGVIENNSKLYLSNNRGLVSGKDYNGGLVGSSDHSQILDSYNEAAITGSGSSTGGLAGAILNNSRIINTTLDGSNSNNTVYNSGTVRGQEATGGLVGKADQSTITGAYNRGAITGTAGVGGLAGQVNNGGLLEKSFNEGTVAGGNDVGGIAGSSMGGVITDSYNIGTVVANKENSTNTGGLVGSLSEGTVADSYNTGSVTGVNNVGGGVGDNNGTLNHVFNSGAVSGTGAVGGLVAANNGSVISSVWDTETSGQSSSAGGIGLTTSGSMKQANYLGWDFANKWYMSEDGTRPILRSEYRNNIINAHQLQLMNIGLNANYTIAQTIDMNELNKANGLWNTTKGFIPIGTTLNPYTGTFYGGTITGLKMNRPDSDYVGLFGYTNNANIYYVRLENADITGRTNVGGIVGQQNGGYLYSSYIDGSISGTDNTGGIVGKQIGGSHAYSNNYAQVHGSNSNTGGVAGSVSDVTIQNTTNYGEVTGKNQTGGLVGSQTSGGITNSGNNQAKVTGTGDNTGGLIGQASGVIINGSSNTGTVNGINSTGGLVGLMNGGSIQNNGSWYSYNLGTVTGSGDNTGGIAGKANAEVIRYAYNTGDVSGASYTGGLVGYQGAEGAISTSYNNGVVAGSSQYTGGLTGYLNAATVTDAYNSGAVSGSGTYTGGVAGYLNNGAVITRAYNRALVDGTEDVGGLAGGKSTNSTVTGSYWDINTSGQNMSAGGTGKTTAQMMSPATFSGWDFTNTWGIIDGVSYPYLKWQFAGTPQIVSGMVSGTNGSVAGKAVQVYNYTSPFGKTTTGANGFYYLAGTSTIGANSPVFAYISADEDNKGVSATMSNGGAVTGLDIEVGTLTISGNGMTNNYLGYLKNYVGTDIPFSVSLNYSTYGNNLQLDNGFNLKTVGGSTYNPGGNVITSNGSQIYNGALSLQTGTTLQADNGSISLGNVNAGGNHLLVKADGSNSDVTLNGTITSNASGDAVILAAGRDFINNQGSNALNVSNGRWLVYSTDPTNGTDKRNGLHYDFKQYNAEYGDTVQGSGNGFLYSVSPSVNVTLAGNVTKTYDGSKEVAFGDENFVISGTIDGDSIVASGSGLLNDKNVGSDKDVTVTKLSVGSATNGTAAVYGYKVTDSSGAVKGTVTPKGVTVSLVGQISKVYDGNTVAELTAGHYAFNEIVNGDDLALNANLGVYENRNSGSNKVVSFSGLSLSGLDAKNYTLSSETVSGSEGTITPAILVYHADQTVRAQGLPNPSLSGTVTGFVGGDTLSNATSGTLEYTSTANANSPIGVYPVIGSGLSANNGNYVLVQAEENATALKVNANEKMTTSIKKSDDAGKHTPNAVSSSSETAKGSPLVQVVESGVNTAGGIPSASASTHPATTQELPSSLSIHGIGDQPANYTLTASENTITLSRTGHTENTSSETAVRNIMVVAIGQDTQSVNNYTVTTGAGALSIASASAQAPESVPADPSSSVTSGVFTLTGANGGVAEFKVSYADGALSIKPLNASAAAMTQNPEAERKILAATGMVAAEEKFGIQSGTITAVYIHNQ